MRSFLRPPRHLVVAGGFKADRTAPGLHRQHIFAPQSPAWPRSVMLRWPTSQDQDTLGALVDPISISNFISRLDMEDRPGCCGRASHVPRAWENPKPAATTWDHGPWECGRVDRFGLILACHQLPRTKQSRSRQRERVGPPFWLSGGVALEPWPARPHLRGPVQ